MKCVINIAMAVMLIAGFQQASADVCKLKVNSRVLEAINGEFSEDEIWVNKDNGNVSPFLQHNQIHIVKSSVAAFNGNGGLKDEYKNAIFCNDKGEVVINVNGITRGENDDDFKKRRSDEAKRQFENIIKCGLLTGDKKRFNEKIFYNPFVEPVNETLSGTWQMPGISAFVQDDRNIANVYCAMKTARQNENNFWRVDNNMNDYIGAAVLPFYSYEHTERQLVVNHMVNGVLSVNGPVQYNYNRNLMPAGVNAKNNLQNGNLFVWTKGNPCTSGGNGNGDICCVQWYNKINNVLSRMNNVYFSELSANSLTNERRYDCDTSAIKNILIYAKAMLIKSINMKKAGLEISPKSNNGDICKLNSCLDWLQSYNHGDSEYINIIVQFFEDEHCCPCITVEEAFNSVIINTNTKLKLTKL